MRIGTVGSIWEGSARNANLGFVRLAAPIDAMPAPQPDPMASRLRDGERLLAALTPNPVDLIIDTNTEGLGFLRPEDGSPHVELLHEKLGCTLVSHFIDPLLTCMRGLPMGMSLAALQSHSWWKLTFDKAMTRELQAFGIPSVAFMGQAAPDRIAAQPSTREPLDLSRISRAVGFCGSQATNYFGPNAAHRGDHQLIGAMAIARRAEDPAALFYDSYHTRYGVADPVSPTDSHETQAAKITAYYSHKLFYIAAVWVAQRNRYVRFLKTRLGDDFHVQGSNWESIGVAASKPTPGYEEFLQGFRTTLINLNLNNGNTETGLNQRAFEITAAGGFMLCAHSEEVADFFHIGEECDTFRDEDDLLEKVAYYRARPQRAAEIAWAGQHRTLREHLYSHRLAAIAMRHEQSLAPTTLQGAAA